MVSINNSDNNTVGGSNSGVTNTLTVTNSSNTANSASSVAISVGGATASDPQTTYTVTGVTNWSQGIDNSVSDNYVISASNALGTTNVVSMTTAGAVSLPLGNLDVTRSASGAEVSTTSSNTSNTANSNASNFLTVAGTSAGDARVQYSVSGGGVWTEGLDNSDSDAYVLSASSALGTTNVLRASASGQINLSLQPSFYAFVNAQVLNVTGNGAAYTAIFNSESYDIGSNFNTTTGAFTAPVAGKYFFTTSIRMSGILAGMNTGTLSISASGGSISTLRYAPNSLRDATNIASFPSSTIFSLAAGETVTVIITFSSSTLSADIDGGASVSYFAGCLLS